MSQLKNYMSTGYAFSKNHREACLLASVAVGYVLGMYSWFFKPALTVHGIDIFGMLLQTACVAVPGAAVGEIYKKVA